MPRLGLVIVASLAGAESFAMMSSALRRAGSSGAKGARRSVMAFLGGASTTMGPSSSAPFSRWASTVMSATAASTAGGPSLSVHKRESPAHPAYDVVEEDFVAEYGATTTLYKHKKSGAEVLSVQIEDDNKVYIFLVGNDAEGRVRTSGTIMSPPSSTSALRVKALLSSSTLSSEYEYTDCSNVCIIPGIYMWCSYVCSRSNDPPRRSRWR